MTISLEKGQKVELEKGLAKIKVALGWDTQKYQGAANFDLDASAFLLDKQGKLASDGDIVFYGMQKTPDGKLAHKSGAIIHSGDDLTGGGDKDNEIITVELDKVPSAVDKIVFPVTIYEYDKRKQNFGMVSKAFVRVIDPNNNNKELLRYDLGEDYSTQTSVIVAEVYRHNGDWKFHAVGQGIHGGIKDIIKSYGLPV